VTVKQTRIAGNQVLGRVFTGAHLPPAV